MGRAREYNDSMYKEAAIGMAGCQFRQIDTDCAILLVGEKVEKTRCEMPYLM